MTPRQRQVFDFIVRYRKEKGFSPSITEIGEALGMSRSNVAGRVDKLVNSGVLSRIRQGARTLEPVDKGMRVRLGPDVLAQVTAYAKQQGITPETAVAEAARSYFGCAK